VKADLYQEIVLTVDEFKNKRNRLNCLVTVMLSLLDAGPGSKQEIMLHP
jgi:hypothetical protein